MDKISNVILIVLVAYFVGMFLWFLVKKYKQTKIQQAELDTPVSEPTLSVVGATVKAKEVGEETFGNPRFPKRKTVFTILFVTDAGEEMPLQVTEDVFAKLQEGDSGSLALHNDQYYDFLKEKIQSETPAQNQE